MHTCQKTPTQIDQTGSFIRGFIEFGSPSGAASNLGLTIVTLADFSDYDDDDVFFNYNDQDFFIILI